MTAPPELEPINLAIGERLRLARMMRGVTQEELGYTLGLTFQQIQKYEKAVNRIPAARLWLIAKALDLPPAYFFEGLEGAFDAEAAAAATEMLNFVSSSEGAALIDRFRAIQSEEARQALVHLMTTMARESANGSGD